MVEVAGEGAIRREGEGEGETHGANLDRGWGGGEREKIHNHTSDFKIATLDLVVQRIWRATCEVETRQCEATTLEDDSFFPHRKEVPQAGLKLVILHTVQMFYQLSR